MKIVIVSDIHLGDPASQICTLDPQKKQAVIGPKYEAFAKAAGEGNDFLILLGDVLDFSIQKYRDTYEVARIFFRQVKKDNIAETLVYVPGNHDIDVWHSVEYQVNIINRITKGKKIKYFRHSVPGVIDDRPDSENPGLTLAGVSPKFRCGKRVYGGLFLDYLVQSPTGKPELKFYFAYPNVWLVNDQGESVLITHGHYFETYYALAGELSLKLASDELPRPECLTLKEMVGLNFPLMQFACSGIGQAGLLTKIIARVQREVKDGILTGIKGYLSKLPKALTQIFRISCLKRVLLKIGIKLAEWPLWNELRKYRSVRFKEDFMKDEKDRERFRRFYRSSLRELDELRTEPTVGVCIPPPKIVIYGHTHTPISWGSDESNSIAVDGIKVKLYNAGGWLTKKVDNIEKFVGAEVFKYETGCGLSSVSIEPQNDSQNSLERSGHMQHVPEEKHLAWLLRIFTVLFAIGGFLFLFFPQIPHFFKLDPDVLGVTGTLKEIAKAALKIVSSGDHWNVEVTITERFWVFSFFSMMMTIGACCYIASLNVRKYRKLVIPVLVEKSFGASAALIYFLFLCQATENVCWAGWRNEYFPWFLVFLSDFPLFVLLLIFYMRAHTGAIPEDYVSGAVDPERYKPMLVDKPVLGGAKQTIVSAVRGDHKTDTLDQVLNESKFFDVLEKYRLNSSKEKADFKIVIKPNFMMTYNKKDCTTYTDPELVEHLIDRLIESEYTNLTIVESQNTYGTYFKNRDVRSVARYVGYRVAQKGSASGGKYRIVDLTEEAEPYDYQGSFGKHMAAPTWKDADFRISFAKNKTHSFCYFTLTIKNIYGTLPAQNKYREYHKKREFDWPTIESLKHFPVHFGIIDAWFSADGQMGVIADVTPEHTKTIIGGEKLVAVDHISAKLMDLEDPCVSRFHQMAVEAFGNPENKIKVISNIDQYDDWQNVSSLLPELLDVAEEAPWAFSHFFMSAFIWADLEAFPCKVNGKILRWIRNSPVVEWLIDQFFATHRNRFKKEHRKKFPHYYPGGDAYGKIKEC
jgi:uncharacterized protein (DUF362 family)/predicted phosphodiesterase